MTDFAIKKLPAGTVADDKLSATIPAGRYFIGDPCYLAGDLPIWDKLVDAFAEDSNDFRSSIYGALVNGHTVLTSSTAYGDGGYEDGNGNMFAVDAGMIGATSMKLLAHSKETEETLSRLGVIRSFSEPVTLSYDDGVILFESASKSVQIRIDTN